jgi:hypothetical protein
MPVTPIYVGQRLLVEMEFRLLGAPTDPTLVQLIAHAPDGTQTVYTYPSEPFTRRDIGLYEVAVLVEVDGGWVFRGEGAGVVDAVHEYAVTIEPSAIT